ncbi:hypothetical protein SAMN05660350_04654 [Geodermatophilus obscurus]|uniref:DDE superfamily endonuclease n=1 Tax=Geodermatophilus obscurus TaxID=1861 RepID=A0A1M7V0C3_9ACTN|nr:transposase family protein [Geodermatophilus obscurus]SHN88668.1 hypothetical protein SAMN05660350_04654 [Geodermatophilus obscurus]
MRPLLAERGCTVEGGNRLRTLADVVAPLGARGRVGLLDATEVRVRRPAAGRAGRQRFVPDQARPGSFHDLTQVRQAGLVDLLALTSGVTLLAGAGYQG